MEIDIGKNFNIYWVAGERIEDFKLGDEGFLCNLVVTVANLGEF
jgi:hypothetical protein